MESPALSPYLMSRLQPYVAPCALGKVLEFLFQSSRFSVDFTMFPDTPQQGWITRNGKDYSPLEKLPALCR